MDSVCIYNILFYLLDEADRKKDKLITVRLSGGHPIRYQHPQEKDMRDYQKLTYKLALPKDHPDGHPPKIISDNTSDFSKFSSVLNVVKNEKEVLILMEMPDYIPRETCEALIQKLPRDSYIKYFDNVEKANVTKWVLRQKDMRKYLITCWGMAAGYEAPAVVFVTKDMDDVWNTTHCLRAKARLVVYHIQPPLASEIVSNKQSPYWGMFKKHNSGTRSDDSILELEDTGAGAQTQGANSSAAAAGLNEGKLSIAIPRFSDLPRPMKMSERMESLFSSLNGLMVEDNGEINILPDMNEKDGEFIVSNLTIPEGSKISNVREYLNGKRHPKPAIVQVVTSILERHRQEVLNNPANIVPTQEERSAPKSG